MEDGVAMVQKPRASERTKVKLYGERINDEKCKNESLHMHTGSGMKMQEKQALNAHLYYETNCQMKSHQCEEWRDQVKSTSQSIMH